MKTFSTPSNGPVMSWIGTGIGLTVAGLAMIPINVLTAVGIGCIVGGISVIGAAFMRSSHSD